jgi:hypothetical protein
LISFVDDCETGGPLPVRPVTDSSHVIRGNVGGSLGSADWGTAADKVSGRLRGKLIPRLGSEQPADDAAIYSPENIHNHS